jgi:hypothetical protein
VFNAGALSTRFYAWLSPPAGGTTRFPYRTDTSTTYTVNAISHDVLDKLTLRAEHGVLWSALKNDVDAGNDSLVGANAWTAADVFVGQNVGNSGTLNGVISQPRPL